MPRISFSPAEIETFLSLAETGSFSRSAVALKLSQPAVSARILHLEQTLGVPLFHRTTRRVTITAAGERLRVRLDRAIAELRGLVDELRDEANLHRGRLVLGASPSVAAGFLAEAISHFHAEHPEVEIVLHDDFFGRALGRLLDGSVDLAIIPFEPTDDALDFELLLTDRFLLAVPPEHELATKRVVRMADLAEQRLITMPSESAAWTTIRRAFEQSGLPFRPSMQTRNSHTIMALVRAGYGVAFVTELLSRTMPCPGIELRQLQGVNLERRVGIITTKGRAMQPAAKAFRDTLRTTARRVASRLSILSPPRSKRPA
jgi:DNA-binding transcriptional LysR family regulator